ncbi:esterase [Kocuria tytonis]|uniref:Esterase n=1 Tax=Kocuria tytonis TaxID=2054280 RepID=A0A495AAZ4_9MICC|nr:esterase [Kocuria tytonis]
MRRASAAAALSLAVLAPVAAPASATAPPVQTPAHAAPAAATSGPLLIGHRGAAGTAPENTVSAFEEARSSHADFFELDVQLSADGVPFIFHDDVPARTTNVAQVFPGRENDPITSFTWAELQRLETGSHFSGRFAGEKIPHFDDAAKVAGNKIGVFVEIKSPQNSPGLEKVVADSLRNNPAWNRLVRCGKIEVLGFDAASNRKFARLAPEVPLQQLMDTVPDAATLAQIATYADHFGTDYRLLDAAGVQRVKAAGLGMGVYTVDSTAAYDSVVALGVDRVTGDFPVQFSRHARGQKAFPQNTGVRVAGAVNDVPGNDLQPETGEHVILQNTTRHPVDVSGYRVRDTKDNTLTVGRGYVLAPGARLNVYTGPGTNRPGAYYNGAATEALDNEGDSVALWSSHGTLQDTFAN